MAATTHRACMVNPTAKKSRTSSSASRMIIFLPFSLDERCGQRASAGAHHLLNASLSFSPACFRLPFVWSALPSARRLSLPLSLPAVSFSFPLACSAVFLALSVVAMTGPSLGREQSDGLAFRAELGRTLRSGPLSCL